MQAERSLHEDDEARTMTVETVEGSCLLASECTEQKITNDIPRFYPYTKELIQFTEDRVTSRIVEFLRPFGEGLPLVALKTLLRDMFGLPVSLGFALHRKLVPLSENIIPVTLLLEWLSKTGFASSSSEKRFFDILRSEDCDFITHEDLRPVILGIIVSHPGLVFLKGASEFQDRYAETVIYRMFYLLNPTGAKLLSLRDIKRGKLLEAILSVEAEEDVNTCTQFFSYEHFYVIYCKFWDLDTDHDFLLSREDFLRYGNHSLTYRIADRLFEGAARPLSSNVPNKMGYEDFVWFILSEEDKTSDSALNYWFRAIDLSQDDRLTQDELLWFYEEQLSRMECLSQETVAFDDVMAQMHDMLQPHDPFFFTLRDLKQSRQLAGNLFNTLFNLTKFISFEMRDPFSVKQEREFRGTEWERYAKEEYVRLALEDDDMEEDVDGYELTE
jgi:serine/threonine-protein phosphatase 2A regulatory subunit B''